MMKKRLLSILLALTLLLSLVPIGASAEELSGECGENASWTFADGILTISGEGKMGNYYPEPMGSFPGAIGDPGTPPWYSIREEITSVTIEEGITGGGENAFYGCINLSSVTLPGTLTEIAENMFRSCGSLTGITIPEGVTSIGATAFYFCGSLAEVSIPSTVKTIGFYAFAMCHGMTSVVLPEGVTTMEHCVFANCSNLRSVYIPLSMESMSREWVTGCELTDIYYPGTQEQWDAIELTWADLPADEPNPSLVNATIHFQYITSGKCGDNATYDLRNGVLTISGEGDVKAFPIPWENQKESITAIVVEEGITSIQVGAFENCTNLVSVTLPEESCFLYGRVFSGCTSLKEITLPKNMPYPEPYSSIGNIIDDSLFENCAALERITIPASIAKIGQASFAGCTGLKQIYFLGDAPSYICSDPPVTINGTLVVRSSFQDVTATVYYPQDNETWTEEIMQNYGGTLTWEPYEVPYESPFTDLIPGFFYEDAVAWAVKNKITNGKTETTFAPDETCTRGQVVTFLWRYKGEPAPTDTKTSFTDVKTDFFYTDAVAWALENEITNGMGDGTFGVDEGCTRGQVVTFLWRTAGCPAPENSQCVFTDLEEDSYYYDAVLWAVENNITNGTSATTFSPEETCTRGQIVTFLHRFAG